MSPRAACRLALLVLGSSILLCPSAQADQALNLGLYETYIKTESSLLVLAVEPFKDLFSPTTVSCPGGETCTIRVEVSAEYYSPFLIRLRVAIDGSPAAPSTDGAPLMIGPGVDAPNPRTFAWAVTGMGSGRHTVDVEAALFTLGGQVNGAVRVRTLTITVFKERARRSSSEPAPK
jgi:hypothetical protein